MNSNALALVLCLSFVTASAGEPTKVPYGKPVLLDGRVSADEWKDAVQLPLGDAARLYVKESAGFVWVALEFLKSPTGTVDLYLAPGDGKLYNLHASAKLGERVLSGKEWSNEWTWWNNHGWSANVSRVDSWEKRTFLDERYREFQIARSRFPAGEWRLMVELMTPGQPSWITTALPAGARNTAPNGWIPIRFADGTR